MHYIDTRYTLNNDTTLTLLRRFPGPNISRLAVMSATSLTCFKYMQLSGKQVLLNSGTRTRSFGFSLFLKPNDVMLYVISRHSD